MFWGDLLVTQALCNCVHAELSPSLETGTSDGQRGLGSRNSQMGTSNATMNHKDTVITKVQGLPLWKQEGRPDCSGQWGSFSLWFKIKETMSFTLMVNIAENKVTVYIRSVPLGE